MIRRDSDPYFTTPEHSNTIQQEAATALLEIIKTMESKGKIGGESLLHVTDGTGEVYRLTFCRFDGHELCAFCGGTGMQDLLNSN